ncbi:hypothetical protein INR49_015669 [Caranx melampygus]|nr:hypothetical protein INR49_015669 [Caranx melampygus]
MDLLNSNNSVQQASGMDTSSIADVLTPQSEHQESVPNSDEGYYDSTTPGPDEALVDYTKHSQMLSELHNSVDGLETNSAFTPNMEALPTIVTFDVVDMHNEGEYDEQIHMELEEDISSPYQEFEESYLQKDAFAEFDYQMLDLYEQNLISNTWAIASLPRHLGLTRVSQSMPNPLSLDRRSRSLDTEGLELNMPDTYREKRAAIVSCAQTEKDSERDSSPYYKKNVLVSASDVKDSSSIMALSWQTSFGYLFPSRYLATPTKLRQRQWQQNISVTGEEDDSNKVYIV